jgi:hypothetical protein
MLIHQEEPRVAVNFEKGFYSDGEAITLNADSGIKISLGAVDYKKSETVYNDEARVNWVINLTEYKNMQILNTEEVKFHTCTREDINDF